MFVQGTALRVPNDEVFDVTAQPRPGARLEPSCLHECRPLRPVRAAAASVLLEDRDMRQLVAQHFFEKPGLQLQQAAIQSNHAAARHAAPQGCAQSIAEPNVHAAFEARDTPERCPRSDRTLHRRERSYRMRMSHGATVYHELLGTRSGRAPVELARIRGREHRVVTIIRVPP